MTALGDLSPAKRALLEERLLQRRGAKGAGGAIPRRQPGDPLVLSYAQELIWTTQQITPDSIAYNVPRPMRLEGHLDLPALQWALDRIMDRHEVLRSNVLLRDGAPHLVVREAGHAPLSVIDLTTVPDAQRSARSHEVLRTESRKPFDLAHDPMLRATVVRESDEAFMLLLASHHIASDGWSTAVLFRELATLYGARLNGAPAGLADLPIQYSDFALWQRRWLDGPQGAAQLEYWREQLEGAPQKLSLPTDKPRPASMSFRGARLSRVGPSTLHEQLQELGRQERATLFMTLLAAFVALLSRYTGETDIVVGSPIANRNRSELESLIGYFSNTLVLRTDVSGDPSFRELLGRVRDVALGGFANPDLPFETLIDELRPRRNLSHTPIYQVLFVLQTLPSIPPQLPGLATTRPKYDPGWAKFDLTLSLSERLEGINASWEYATDLFERETISSMAVHYERLLQAVVDDPDRPLSEIPLLDQRERQLEIETPNQTSAPWRSDRCLHDLFDESVRRTPGAVAVSADGNETTYAQLEARSNRLAHALMDRGVGPGRLVGICIERSTEMAVAALAVLKAGAAYVPLDPTYPDEQLLMMLDDSAPVLVLCSKRSLPSIPPTTVPAVLLDELAAESAVLPAAAPDVSVTPDSLAYVMYTSGSTGRPKGVMVEHRGVVNLCHAVVRTYGLGPKDRVLQFSSFSFDISVEEMFGAWTAGAALILRNDTTPLGGPRFHTWLRHEEITVMDLPTAFWHAWVDDLGRLGSSVPRGLRTVIVGGERARPDVYGRWLRLGGQKVRLFNTYGPTETSVVATIHEARPEDADDPDGISIGSPLANLRAYVLDEHLEPVPRGVYGELCVGGVGVARGYLNRKDLTEERFVRDPFSEDDGARLFRTGDVVRRRRNGELEFAGRKDRQVKVRGFRVEPDGVEAVLRGLPGVGDAVVVARADAHGDTRLEAYIVPAEDGTDAGDMRDAAAAQMPHHMVPSAFVMVAELPVTPSGKLDRRALSSAAGAVVRSESRAPVRPGTEQKLIGIWEDVLGIEGISPTDNFFDLGGHSLLAIRMFARIETELGSRLPLATLFEAPTVRALADAVDRHDQGEWSSLVTIQEGDGGAPLVVAPDVFGDTLMGYRELARRLGSDQRVLALRARGLDGRSAPQTRIEDMAAEYVEEIRRIQPAGPYMIAGHCFGGNVALDMARRLRAEGDEVGLLALIDSMPYGHRKRSRPLVNAGLHIATLRGGAMNMEYVKTRLNAAYTRFKRQVWWRGGAALYRRTGLLPRFLRANVAEANLRAAGEYVAGDYPGAVMLFLVGAEDDARNAERVAAWRSLARDGVEVHQVVGDEVNHLSIMREPYVRTVANPLRERISEITAAAAPTASGASSD